MKGSENTADTIFFAKPADCTLPSLDSKAGMQSAGSETTLFGGNVCLYLVHFLVLLTPLQE